MTATTLFDRKLLVEDQEGELAVGVVHCEADRFVGDDAAQAEFDAVTHRIVDDLAVVVDLPHDAMLLARGIVLLTGDCVTNLGVLQVLLDGRLIDPVDRLFRCEFLPDLNEVEDGKRSELFPQCDLLLARTTRLL